MVEHGVGVLGTGTVVHITKLLHRLVDRAGRDAEFLAPCLIVHFVDLHWLRRTALVRSILDCCSGRKVERQQGDTAMPTHSRHLVY